MRWKRHGRYEIAPRPTMPGVWAVRDGGWFVRAHVKDPRTEKLREVSRIVPDGDAEGACAWLQQQLQKIRTGQEEQPRIRFSGFAASLMERKVTRGRIKSAKGRQKWGYVLEHHLIPEFGDLFVDALTRADIEAWQDKIAPKLGSGKGKISPASANTWLSIMRVICKEMQHNPCAGIESFDTSTHHTYTDEEPNALRPEDVPAFFALVREHWPQHYAMITLGLATGLRPSSLRPLRRAGKTPDVLWEDKVLLVRRSHTVKDEVMEKTKTGKKQRLNLPSELLDILRWHTMTQLKSDAQKASELLFPSDVGGFRSPSVLDKPFKHLAKKMKLTYPITPRAMRRTFQDIGRALEISDLVIRSVSGHATEQMQQHYSTVQADEQRQAIGKVLAFVGGK